MDRKTDIAPILLTIAIPAYNGGSNFEALFTSMRMLELHESKYEILVVDNASTDNTEQVIGLLKDQVPNLRYIRNSSNIGRIENWNKAMEYSRGKYIILMNVNDRFLPFELRKYLQYLEDHLEVPMVLTDMQLKESIYPNWTDCGLIELKAYLKETFLNPDYLEFHSLGVLQQHIFRAGVIRKHDLQFDPKLPRTTDRVFTAQVVEAGGGTFYYTNQRMVSWHLNEGRYHNNVHNKEFNFEELWINEYKANLKLSQIVNISFAAFLESQLVLASSYCYKQHVQDFKKFLLKNHIAPEGMEFPTASIYYRYLKTIAKLNKLSFSPISIHLQGLEIVTKEFLRHHDYMKRVPRSLKNILNPKEYGSPQYPI